MTDAHQNDAEAERNKVMTKIVTELTESGQTFEVSQKLYTQWANAGSYDEMLQSHKELYAGPFIVRDKIVQLMANPEQALVLDLGSGTGNVAQMLMEEGFKNFHGLDPCKEFNVVARSKGLYQRLMEQYIGNGAVVDVETDTYDAIVTVGTFFPGHIPCDSLHEIVRILKPGGYFINGMREEFLTNVPEYKDRLEPLTRQLEEEGKWRRVSWEKYENHYKEKGGIIMVFQAC